MTRRLLDPLPQSIRDSQWRAADPAASVWVEANAGAGKTHVLTQRVLRLLLSGVAPDAILCLTYTKAAAAEMRRRVARELGGWAVMDEPAFAVALDKLCGSPPLAGDLRRARTLFAHALETPGGLKIQTIHAFCESVLHRFPLEAGVPFDFEVLEEHQREALVLVAREAVLAGGLNGDPDVAAAVESLFELLSDAQLTQAIEAALQQARKLRPVLRQRELAKANLLSLVGDGRTRDDIEAAVAGERLMGPEEIAEYLAASPTGQFEAKLAALNALAPSAQSLLDCFLTQSRTVPKTGFPQKTVRTMHPDLAAIALAEAQRLEALAVELRRAELVERSEALLDVLHAISERYEADKRARSLLDFDDLIAHAVRLFENAALGPWVRYKLDAGITHILVDESQDTNPEQWRAVDALVDEFFAGQGAVEQPRTLFAVGDVKQSIYSFQGAEPKIFVESGRRYQARAAQVSMDFSNVPLHTSFRTLRGVLQAVDKVFDSPEKRAAVLSDVVHHDTARAEAGGTVTLWPPVADQDDGGEADDWPLEIKRGLQSAARQVAERIAGEIKGWIADRRPLGPRGRPVRADDVLILVQMRGALFREIIRALHREGLPTPGADRLEVTSHIGVLDLMALGDVVLNPGDDLQLAALLRSPLFDLTEEDLFAVASPRPSGSRLWDALRTSSLLAAHAAYAELGAWRARLDFDRPYEFYANVLYGADGLKRFHARFGGEVDDVFAEFLDLALEHEQAAQPSLLGFLAAMRSRDVSIARELSEGGDGVRVMTVHGAKGLESPIVILADAASKPMGSQVRSVVHITADPPLLVHASRSESHVPQTDPLRQRYEAAQREEYWRKLYVGMTRAEDELYVTGTLTRTGKLDDTWYGAIEGALRAGAEEVPDAAGALRALVYPRERPPAVPLRAGSDSATIAPAALALPPLPAHIRRETVRPSSAFVPADAERALDTINERALDPELARQRGIAVHLLLQHLCALPSGDWSAAAMRALAQRFPGLADLHGEIARKATGILATPEFAHLFGPWSRAEVPFLAMARRRGTPVRLAGRIDRLVATPDSVLVVDFKSDATEPLSPAAVKDAYLTQLGLYALVARELFPGRAVEAAILWTAPESLMIVPAAPLLAAVEGFTMA